MRALRDAVRTGRLAPGVRLPSSRALASDLGLARNTVADAYGELVAEGWLTARQGSGTRVARRAVFQEPAHEPPGGRPSPGSSGGPSGQRSGRSPGQPSRARMGVSVRSSSRPAHDLMPGSPDLASFPRAAWLSAARRALTAAPSDAFGYGDPAGRPELRHALADYLARARGVRAAPERIVVCAGFVQALMLLSRALSATGVGAVAVDSYGLDFHWDLIHRAGLRTVPLSKDEHGTRVEELDSARDVRAVLLTPAHHFPTGMPLSPDRRAAVVDWARRTGGLVLEDDYDGEFRYDRRPVGALQGLDPERVVHLGTTSKSLAPALRLGWMVLPGHLVGEVLAAKSAAERLIGALDQLTLAEFITCGAYDRHLRGMRLRYRRRRDQLVAALAERAPHIRVTGIAAGLHAVLELPPGTERSVVQGAAWQGLALEGLSRYRYAAATEADSDGPGMGDGMDVGKGDGSGGGEGGGMDDGLAGAGGSDGLVVGYGTPPDHAFAGAIDALCRVLP
ncbi:PLP-dependent aminotransferase family protein [Streptomyces sp. NPDC004647]|uniref:MocR-like pyridoxine biosynthesis transcription factor PdxR n=1 Tax=Streptomyces sp. NPDC004647 TaxID=3154671 RepID=UPI0033A8E07F